MRVDRLRRLIEFVRALPEEKFFFGSFANEFDDENKCGAVCCAAGWLPKLDPSAWEWSSGEMPQLRKSLMDDVDVDLGAYFEIEPDVVDTLFYPTLLLDVDATPAEWADHAERIVKGYEDAN